MTSKNELWTFILSNPIHHSLFKLSFIFVPIYMLDNAFSFLLVELKFSLIGVLVLYSQFALSMIHEVFELSNVDLLNFFIESHHPSLNDTVLCKLAFKLKICRFQYALPITFVIFPRSLVVVPTWPSQFPITLSHLSLHFSSIEASFGVNDLIDAILNELDDFRIGGSDIISIVPTDRPCGFALPSVLCGVLKCIKGFASITDLNIAHLV